MFGDIEVQNASAMVANDEETVEYAEGDGRNGEEIHRRDGFPMVAKKGKPALGRIRVPLGPFHPARDRSLGNIKAEHEEFAVDARSSPGRVLGHHLEDQIANLLGYGSSSDGLPDLGDQHPVPMETGSVPPDHRFGCDNQERLLPPGPARANEQPEEPVEEIKPWARMTPFQHGKLLAQCQILEQEALARAKEANEGCEADAEELKHGEQLYQNAAGDDGRYVIDSRACRSFGEPQPQEISEVTTIHGRSGTAAISFMIPEPTASKVSR
jgi:hypothetical protein